jgi:hypothetical protein
MLTSTPPTAAAVNHLRDSLTLNERRSIVEVDPFASAAKHRHTTSPSQSRIDAVSTRRPHVVRGSGARIRQENCVAE